jgi:hypothetical protein
VMEYYPDQLVHIAKLCEALNAIDRESGDSLVTLKNKIEVVDGDDSTLGFLVDEIGGSWSFLPVENSNGCDSEDDEEDDEDDEDADDEDDDDAKDDGLTGSAL